jgi:hypothetical protein
MLQWLAQETGKTSRLDVEPLVPAGSNLASHIHRMLSRKGAEDRKDEGYGLLDAHANRRVNSSYKDSYTSEGPLKSMRVRCNNCKLPSSEVDDVCLMWRVSIKYYVTRFRITCPTKRCCDAYKYMLKGKRAGVGRTGKESNCLSLLTLVCPEFTCRSSEDSLDHLSCRHFS